MIRKDYTVGANISETAVDDPDQMFYENYACGSDRNYTGFCDKEVDTLIDRQSAESNAEKRRQLVWEIERRLARDASRSTHRRGDPQRVEGRIEQLGRIFGPALSLYRPSQP